MRSFIYQCLIHVLDILISFSSLKAENYGLRFCFFISLLLVLTCYWYPGAVTHTSYTITKEEEKCNFKSIRLEAGKPGCAHVPGWCNWWYNPRCIFRSLVSVLVFHLSLKYLWKYTNIEVFWLFKPSVSLKRKSTYYYFHNDSLLLS